MKESYYKDGQLFEKFITYHNLGPIIRNRTELYMTNEIKTTCINPINCTIEKLREAMVSVLEGYMQQNPSHGKCWFSEISLFGSIIGHKNWQERSFSFYARGRGTCTITIKEDVFKDAENNWAVVDGSLFVYNKIETIN